VAAAPALHLTMMFGVEVWSLGFSDSGFGFGVSGLELKPNTHPYCVQL